MYRVKHCVYCTIGTPNLYLGGWGIVPWTPGGFSTQPLTLILYDSHVLWDLSSRTISPGV
jgi:hypothetical protein